MYLETKDISLYTKVTHRLKNGRYYRNFEEERAGLQLQQFTAQKSAQEHSVQNQKEILWRAQALFIPTVLITPKIIQFMGNESVIADEIGPAKETNIYADVSYTLTTSEEGRLAFGLKGGVTLLNVNLLDVVLPQTGSAGDPVFDENINDTFPNFGAGVYYYTNKWYAGFSVPNIMKSEHLDKDNINTKASEEVHYFLTGGYVFDLSSTVKFKPSLMFKGVAGAPVSVDINANFLMYDRFEVGASYRIEDAVSLLFNFGVTPDFRIGYAYDYTISEFSNSQTGGSHEIILLYDIDFSKKNVKSPRFF